MADDWNAGVIGDLVSSSSEMLGTRAEPEILTCTEHEGLVLQRDKFSKRIATSDTSAYKVVRRFDIVYNPYLLWAGAIGQLLDQELGITSPVYEVFSPKQGADPRFVGLVLTDPMMRNLYDGISLGSIPRRRRAPSDDFLTLPVRLPSLAEQRRVADLVDAATRVQARNKAVASASRRAHRELRESLITRSHALSVRLGSLLTDIDGGVSPVARPEPPAPGLPGVLKLSAVGPGHFSPGEVKALLPGTNMPPRALVAEGDVLMTRSNTPEKVGHVCRVDRVLPNTYMSDLTLRLHPDTEQVNADYLSEALNTRHCRAAISGMARGTSASMRKVSRGLIRELAIKLPDLPEQEAVAAQLRAFSDVSRNAAEAEERAQALAASLRGKLLRGGLPLPSSYDRLLGAT